jgi:hypothetical protein
MHSRTCSYNASSTFDSVLLAGPSGLVVDKGGVRDLAVGKFRINKLAAHGTVNMLEP